MGKGIPGYFAHDKYNISPQDVARLILHCEPEAIREKVIVTPCWNPEEFLTDAADSFQTIYEGNYFSTCVYELTFRDQPITLIRSGVGAPVTGDVVLALGCTPCKHLIFTGSFGGLTPDFSIGDLLTITESIAGEGYSSYLKEGNLSPNAFLKPASPDTGLNGILEEYTASHAVDNEVALHKGRIFSSDTIIAQFFHLDEIVEKYGCVGIEMETSAVFNCAKLVDIPAAALLIVSDVIPVNKSLFSGRTEEERTKYKNIKKTVLSWIILDTLCDERLC